MKRKAPPFVLVPGKTALIVVDMQNDFVRVGAPQEVPDARRTLPNLQRLIGHFRDAGDLIVYTKYVTGPKETLIWTWSPECAPPLRSCWKGVRRFYPDIGREAEGAGIVDEISPAPGDYVVEKHGYDAFFNTDLDGILRAHHIGYLVVAGTVTQICVADTVHGAFHRGYAAVTVSDAVSSYDEELHHASLRNIELKYGRVLSTDSVLSELGGQALRASHRGRAGGGQRR